MALHVFETSSSSPELRILIAYENGTVTLRRYANPEKAYSVEGQGWEIIWDAKLHQEASESNFISSSVDQNIHLKVHSHGHASVVRQQTGAHGLCRPSNRSIRLDSELYIFVASTTLC